ncbi:hypothetical protein OsJ_32803 [Oryza sativa Japonica Group]|uniref:Uncharacterized protein n=1 Tax=Oryza sativa subsp. japonica TaxID=39947 RepID=B9G967_ORYSJ|nr:hypothetical protein OsJ_32803 [Oryza sativa Japonica Group]
MELLPLLLLLLLRIVASAPASPLATALFVLGDSTASCAATTLPLNLSLTSSSGNCLFPSAHRLLPDLLAAKMGLPSPPLITTLNGTATEVARGVNFAGEDGGRGPIFRLGNRGAAAADGPPRRCSVWGWRPPRRRTRTWRRVGRC